MRVSIEDLMNDQKLPIVLTVILALAAVATIVASQGSVSRADPWRKLGHRTGWVLLGLITADKDRWATANSFEVVGKKAPTDGYILPMPGDRIRLKTQLDLTILGYRKLGEKDRLKSPTTHQILTAADSTGVLLPAGTIVKVEDLQVGFPLTDFKQVWARVSPVRR